MKVPRHWRVIAVDYSGSCVGVAASYDNFEAALRHQEYLQKTEQVYDIKVETCGGYELKSEFVSND